MKKYLITTPLDFLPDIERKLKNKNCIFAYGFSKDNIIDIVHDIDIWVCQPCPKYIIDSSILKNANKLKIIASTSTGTNHIDMEYCDKHDIKVISLKGNEKTNTIVASSEFTFALMLSLIRKIPFSFSAVKSGKWRESEGYFRSIELKDKTLGIIGFGRIGSNNAKYANAFDMNVIAYDPYVKISESYVEQKNDYTNVLRESDILMICVHLSDSTKNMVNEFWFDHMKDGIYFINTSRGEIVNEGDLLKNLESGKIAAAGLDVICNEMNKDKINNPLIMYADSNSNLIITPHIAGLTYDSERKAAEIILKEVGLYE